jgi:hypothetical protein
VDAKIPAMDCTTAAASVSALGSFFQILGVATVAADLRHSGRMPDVKGAIRKRRRRSPNVVLASARLDQGISIGDGGRAEAEVLRVAVETGDVAGQLRELGRRIEEVRADLEREIHARAEADAGLERSLQPTLQSLQNEITGLRHEFTSDRARAKSRAGIGWAGIAGFSVGLTLNIVGTFMAVGCT